MNQVGWRFYILFVICNLTNALFFWALLPETSKVPLEAMDNLWENAPWFVPTMRRKDYLAEWEDKKETIAHGGTVEPGVDEYHHATVEGKEKDPERFS